MGGVYICRVRGKRDNFCIVVGCRGCWSWSICLRYSLVSSRSIIKVREFDAYRMMFVYLVSGVVVVYAKFFFVYRWIYIDD